MHAVNCNAELRQLSLIELGGWLVDNIQSQLGTLQLHLPQS